MTKARLAQAAAGVSAGLVLTLGVGVANAYHHDNYRDNGGTNNSVNTRVNNDVNANNTTNQNANSGDAKVVSMVTTTATGIMTSTAVTAPVLPVQLLLATLPTAAPPALVCLLPIHLWV